MASTPFRGTLTHRFIEHRASSQAPSPQLESPQKRLSQSHPSPPPPYTQGRDAGQAPPGPAARSAGRCPAAVAFPALRCAPPGRPGVAAGPPMAYDWVGLGYAALVASGGIIGYARAGGGGPGELHLCIWLFIYACVRGAGPLTAFSFPHPRQRPVSGRRAPLRWFGGVGGLPAGPRPKEYLAFSR